MNKPSVSPLRAIRGNFTTPRLDGRTSIARKIEGRRQELIEAVGGNPTPVQQSIIDRIPFCEWYCVELERRIVNGENVDSYGGQYLAWVNTVRRSLLALGLDGTEPEENDPLSFLEDDK